MAYIILAIVLIISYLFLTGFLLPRYVSFLKEKEKILYRELLRAKAKKYVSKRLWSIAKVYDGYLYNDVYLRIKNKDPIMIDHLLLTKAGLYMIDTYGFMGVVHGKLKKDNWECTSIEETYSFPNPIKAIEYKRDYLIKLFINEKRPRISHYVTIISDGPSNMASHALIRPIKTLEQIINRETYRGRYSPLLVEIINIEIHRIFKRYAITKNEYLKLMSPKKKTKVK